MKYKVVIVDDEKNCIEVLQILLQEAHPECAIEAVFTSSLDALEYLKTNEVDLVFSDIQMPFLSGIEMIEKLPNRDFHVIFTTAYDSFALDAIKLSALDYILKPIDDTELEKSFQKFLASYSAKNLQRQLQNIMMQNASQNIENEKIAISFQDRINFYYIKDIILCNSNDNYTNIFLANGEKITASKTIKYFEEQLVPYGFIRTHQSYLVNKQYIESFNRKDGGFLELKNNTSVPISRNKREEVLQLFKHI